MLQINKKTSGPGGFKVAQESIDKRMKQCKLNLPDDLPTKDELFSQLGIGKDDQSAKNNYLGKSSSKTKQFIQDKMDQFEKVDSTEYKQSQPQKKSVKSARLTSEELEQMLVDHRQQMKQIEEEYKQEKTRSISKPKQKSRSQSQKHAKVTYHSNKKLNDPIEKMEKRQKDLTGQHGEFLKGVLPQENLTKLEGERKLIQDADFQNKFKNYLRNKRNYREEDECQVEFDLYQSTSPNPIRWGVKHKHKAMSLSQNSSRKSSKQKRQQEEQKNIDLSEQIFKQIDRNQQNQIDKLATIRYFVSNPELLEAYNIESQELNHLINKYPTKIADAFTLKEFTHFLQKMKSEINHEAFGGLSQVSQSQQISSCLLKREQIAILKNVFDSIEQDMVAPRGEFVRTLRGDIHVARLLHVQAAFVAQIDRIVTLDAVLSQIETSAHEHPFISWKQFMDYFDTPVERQKMSYAMSMSNIKQVDDQDKIDAPTELQQVIQQQFKILQVDEYVETAQLLTGIRRTPLYSQLRKEQIRKKAQRGDLPAETLEQLLNRIQLDAHEYLTYDEFLSYFTRRGTVKFEDEIASLAKSVNVTENMKQTNLIDGYDSDPELHTYQDKMVPRQRLIKSKEKLDLSTYSHRKSKQPHSRSRPPTHEDFLNSIQPKPQYGAHSKPSDYQFHVTQPEPFHFDKRERERSESIRQRKLREMLQEKEKSLHFTPFKPKEIPLAVRQPRFERIMSEQQMRREHVKVNSVQITKLREKPFSFYNRPPQKKARRKYWEEREKFVFKAKTIPWHVHIELLKQMEQEENTKRKERIAKHAHQLAMSSRMPPRMEMHHRQKQAQTFTPPLRKSYSFSAKPIPDFERLHSSFQDQLNRKKQQMRTTEPQPFNFQQSKRSLERPYLDNVQEELVKVDKIEEARKKMSIKPPKQPASTKKWEDNCKKLREEKQRKADKQKKLKEEEEERKRKKEMLRERVQKSEALQDNSKKLAEKRKQRIAELRKEFKQTEVQQKKKIAEIVQKAYDENPLLMERPTKRDVKMEKMKQLAKMDNILKKNKVYNRKEYFNKEEMELLDQVDYLKNHGFQDEFSK